jgi:hypothetical protein
MVQLGKRFHDRTVASDKTAYTVRKLIELTRQAHPRLRHGDALVVRPERQHLRILSCIAGCVPCGQPLWVAPLVGGGTCR